VALQLARQLRSLVRGDAAGHAQHDGFSRTISHVGLYLQVGVRV
jgi:hypothetical protein